MDPITLSTITSALSVLAAKVGEGIAGQAGTEIWERAKAILEIDEEPAPGELAPTLAQHLAANEAAARDVVQLLKDGGDTYQLGSGMVEHIEAKNVLKIENSVVEGSVDVDMS